jgi:hypothetical protein
VVPLVQKMLRVTSVCDIGCGIGTWLQCWRENGVRDVLGIDGDYVDRQQLMIPPSQFRATDLRQSVRCDRRFDLAMSLEVAEHLPADRAVGFVADLTALAPVVLFSAAVPGQGGTNHINEQWQDYWTGVFKEAGFAMIDAIRPKIWNDPRVESWYRQNTLIFCRQDLVSEYPGLTRETCKPISIVHPEEFARRTEKFARRTMSVRQSLAELLSALRRAIAYRIGRSRSA